jgi:hypothetical protein
MEAGIGMNYLAVLVGAVVTVVIGFVWYLPAVFGNAWMSAIGKTREQVEQDFSPLKIVWALVLGFIISYALARLIQWTGMNTPAGGAQIGLLAGVGLVFAATATNHVFAGRPARLTWILGLHHTVECVAVGVLLGAWL